MQIGLTFLVPTYPGYHGKEAWLSYYGPWMYSCE